MDGDERNTRVTVRVLFWAVYSVGTSFLVTVLFEFQPRLLRNTAVPLRTLGTLSALLGFLSGVVSVLLLLYQMGKSESIYLYPDFMGYDDVPDLDVIRAKRDLAALSVFLLAPSMLTFVSTYVIFSHPLLRFVGLVPITVCLGGILAALVGEPTPDSIASGVFAGLTVARFVALLALGLVGVFLAVYGPGHVGAWLVDRGLGVGLTAATSLFVFLVFGTLGVVVSFVALLAGLAVRFKLD